MSSPCTPGLSMETLKLAQLVSEQMRGPGQHEQPGISAAIVAGDTVVAAAITMHGKSICKSIDALTEAIKDHGRPGFSAV